MSFLITSSPGVYAVVALATNINWLYTLVRLHVCGFFDSVWLCNCFRFDFDCPARVTAVCLVVAHNFLIAQSASVLARSSHFLLRLSLLPEEEAFVSLFLLYWLTCFLPLFIHQICCCFWYTTIFRQSLCKLLKTLNQHGHGKPVCMLMIKAVKSLWRSIVSLIAFCQHGDYCYSRCQGLRWCRLMWDKETIGCSLPDRNDLYQRWIEYGQSYTSNGLLNAQKL